MYLHAAQITMQIQDLPYNDVNTRNPYNGIFTCCPYNDVGFQNMPNNGKNNQNPYIDTHPYIAQITAQIPRSFKQWWKQQYSYNDTPI